MLEDLSYLNKIVRNKDLRFIPKLLSEIIT